MRVPVLSNATKGMLRPRSNASRLRTRMPLRAEIAVAFILTSGMASPSAWGHAITEHGDRARDGERGPRCRNQPGNEVGTDTPMAIIVNQKAARSARAWNRLRDT